MKLKELKNWIESLPEEFLEFEVMNAEEFVLDGEYWCRVDKPVISLSVDENSKEILILNESKETK